MNLGWGFPFTIFCPYLRHLYPSPEIPTSPAACTTNLVFFPGFKAAFEHSKFPFFNLVRNEQKKILNLQQCLYRRTVRSANITKK